MHPSLSSAAGWHAGERALQERAGVAARMAEVGARVLRDFMPEQHREFFGLLPYLVVMTILGFSGFWEIMEAWAGQLTHPDLERALVGHQGDVWDPQRDMAAALYGSLLCTGLLALARKLHEQPAPLLTMEEELALEPAGMTTSAMSDHP